MRYSEKIEKLWQAILEASDIRICPFRHTADTFNHEDYGKTFWAVDMPDSETFRRTKTFQSELEATQYAASYIISPSDTLKADTEVGEE